jgi:ribosomal protein S18 acetylase RimI-like enzyme
MELTIRPAAPGDANSLATLHAHVHDLHVANIPQHFKPTVFDDVVAWFNEVMEKPTAHIWIAVEGEVPLGYVCAFRHEREENVFSHPRQWMEIDAIAVSPQRRRNGVGRALVEHVLRFAHAEGLSDVELTSWAFNTDAIAAFRSLGFAPKYSRYSRKSSLSGE